MGRHDQAWSEPSQDPRQVMVGDLPSGDPAQEHVDVAVANLVVDQVRGALVVDGRAGHLDVDPPDLATAVRRSGQAVEVLAGQFAVARGVQPQDQSCMHAGHEGDRERSDLEGAVRFDDPGLRVESPQPHQAATRCAPVDRAAVPCGDARHVERVVEMGVAHQDRVRAWHPTVDHRPIRVDDPAAQQVADGRPGDVRVDEHRGAFEVQYETGDAQPVDPQPVGQAPLCGRCAQRRSGRTVPPVVSGTGRRVAQHVGAMGQGVRHGHGSPTVSEGSVSRCRWAARSPVWPDVRCGRGRPRRGVSSCRARSFRVRSCPGRSSTVAPRRILRSGR